MAVEFLMPKLGLTMEEGTILQWLVDDGAVVTQGTPVMLIETDKVESEVECSDAGRLHRLGVEGDTFRCGTVVGLLLADGEAPPASSQAPPANAPTATMPAPAPAPATGQVAGVAVTNGQLVSSGGDGTRRFVSPNARRLAAERNIDLATVRGTGPGGRIVSEDLDDVAATAAAPPAVPAPLPTGAGASTAPLAGSMVPATVSARQLADLLGVDLAVVPPDPLDGYVTREAVARYVRIRLQPTAPAPTAGAPASQTPTRVRKLSGMRGTIAKRMHASLREMAQLTLTMDADMDAVVADRDARKVGGAAPAYTDYVIAAVAAALHEHPRVNAQMTADGIAELPDIHVGLAVALDEGLVVPVVRHADRLSLTEIATVTARLAASARAGTLGLDDLEGGTFSVSALGMFGVDAFTPVINPPNVAILGVGRIRDDLTLVEGSVEVHKRLTLSLTWDHRVLDGAPAAAFCASIATRLATPAMTGGDNAQASA